MYAIKKINCVTSEDRNEALGDGMRMCGCQDLPNVVVFHHTFLHQEGDSEHVFIVMDLYEEGDMLSFLKVVWTWLAGCQPWQCAPLP